MSTMYVKWDNPERTIIFVEAVERNDGLDGMKAVRRIGELADSVEYTVNLIVHVEGVRYVRSNYLQYFDGVAENLHPRIGCVAIVTSDDFSKDLIKVASEMSRQLRQPIVFVSSVEQARQQLETVYADGYDPLRRN